MPKRVIQARSKAPKATFLKKIGLLLCLVVALGAVLVVISRGVIVLKDWSNQKWYGIEPFRILLTASDNKGADDRYLLEYAPSPPQLLIIKIPADVLLDAGDYGRYNASGLLKLGEIEQVNDALLIQAISQELGLNIDASIKVDTFSENQTPASIVDTIIISTLIKMGASESSNEVDLIRAALAIRNQVLTTDYLDLSTQNIFDLSSDVDGVELRQFNELLVDSLLHSKRAFQSEYMQSIPIVIENTTGQPGKARQWRRLLQAQGFDVVRLVDSLDEIQETQVIVNDNSILETDISGILHNSISSDLQDIVADTSIYRSPIVIRLGLNQ